MSEPRAVRPGSPELDRVGWPDPETSLPLRRPPRKSRILLLVADAGLAEAFFLTSLLLTRGVVPPSGLGAEPSRAWALFLAVLFPLIVGSRGLYRLNRFPSWRGQAAAGVRAVAWSILLSVGGVFLFAREIPYSLRLVLTFYHGMLMAWTVALRPLLTVLMAKSGALETLEPGRVLIVGSDTAARRTARALARGRERMEVVGFAEWDQTGGSPRPFSGLRPRSSISRLSGRPRGPQVFHSTLLDLPLLAAEMGANLVVLARPDLPREQVVRLSDTLLARGIRVRVASNVFNQLIDSIPIERVGGVPLAPVGQTPLNGASERVKRLFDLAAAGVGGLLVLPVVLVLALMVKLSSPGPVLYLQTRIGRHGRPFVFYKFRSMRAENDDSAHRRYVHDFLKNGNAAAIDDRGQKVYKLVDDARVTTIGRFLRRTSLDELPQLLNVLRGEMSLVGPRPCLPFEWEIYKDWQKRRLAVTPGMTGLWQVTGRSYVNFEDMVLLDLFYIANWSLVMDVKLLLRTIPVVIWGKGGL